MHNIDREIICYAQQILLLSPGNLYLTIDGFNENISPYLTEMDVVKTLNKYFQSTNVNRVAVREKQWKFNWLPYSVFVIRVRKRNINVLSLI